MLELNVVYKIKNGCSVSISLSEMSIERDIVKDIVKYFILKKSHFTETQEQVLFVYINDCNKIKTTLMLMQELETLHIKSAIEINKSNDKNSCKLLLVDPFNIDNIIITSAV